MQADLDRWIDRGFKPDRQRGWLVCGLHPGDGASYRRYAVAEYLPGYAGPPPSVHLRRGERMRRYFKPGLEDGRTFVFWGRNYNAGEIPGPERSRSWVNQPEAMHGSTDGTSHRVGQVRYANVEYVYRPDLTSNDYREAVVRENDAEVVFAFQTPYVIAATPPNDDPWGIYDEGCRNGLVIEGDADCDVSVSLDAGRSWSEPQRLEGQLDLTDFAKGRAHYWLRFAAPAAQLRDTNLEIRTVCQANVAVLPRLKDNGTEIRYEASGRRVVSLGPELDLAQSFVSDGGFGESSVTLTTAADKPVVEIHAAGHVASGNPPDPGVGYQIEVATGESGQWQPITEQWSVPRRGDEPEEFWSQSFCYGSSRVDVPAGEPVHVRFHNDRGKRYLREAHLVQETGPSDPLQVRYSWSDSNGEQVAAHVFADAGTWDLPTGTDVATEWVEFEPLASHQE